jgi:predicted permease
MIPRLFRRRSIDARLDQELRFHLEQHTADLVARGHTPEEARRLARVALGGLTQVTEDLRDVHRVPWLHDAWQDARYALRLIRQRPAFAAAVIATLALGIGATTAMFTIAYGVLLRPLPFPRPEHLLTVSEQTDWSNAYGNVWAFAYPNFLDCERQARTLTPGAFRYRGGTITGAGDPEYVDGYETSASLWRLLGTPMAQGRAFRDDEDAPGGAPAIVIGHDLWQRRYAGSPSGIGVTLTFEGAPYTVVGVTPPGFQLLQPADVYLPIGQNTDASLRNRSRHPGLRVWARLAPGATIDRAQAELAIIGRSLEAAYPDSNKGRTFVAGPLRPAVGNVGPTLWLLVGAVALVLVIACVNIASLLLARALSRRREMARRAALGAGRGRLVRQCLAESSILALAGGALGAVAAAVVVQPFAHLWPGTLPRADEVHLDWRVLAFTHAVSQASGVLFGLVPALDTPRGGLDATLRSDTGR